MISSPLAVVLLSCCFVAAAAQGNGNISVGEFLLANGRNQTWDSPSRDFAFGFLPAPDVQDRFLLAVWFAKIPQKTIVWTANGDNPVIKESTVELTDSGLVLRDPSGVVLWRSNGNGTGVSDAAMLDTGNFVIRGRNSGSLWESFQNPTDTILPGQELGESSVLSSAFSATSYKRGKFQLRFTDGLLQLNQIDVFTGTPFTDYFRFNRTNIVGLTFNQSGYILIKKSDGSTDDLAPENVVPRPQDSYCRATLDFDGVFTLYSHSKTSVGDGSWSVGDGSWSSWWHRPRDPDICPIFQNSDPRGSGPCGYNSICQTDQNGRVSCQCPYGFSVLDPKNQHLGCKPNYQSYPIDCKEDGSIIGEDRFEFESMPFIDWPLGDYEKLHPANETECKRSCLLDCTCAVAILEAAELSNGPGNCYKKKIPLSNGLYNREEVNRQVLIKVLKSTDLSLNPPSPAPAQKRQNQAILILSILLGTSAFINILFVAVVSLIIFCLYQKKLQNHRHLVRLLGYCDEAAHRLLVYELMQNGSLASFLFGVLRPSWQQRLQIASGIARGLTYWRSSETVR